MSSNNFLPISECSEDLTKCNPRITKKLFSVLICIMLSLALPVMAFADTSMGTYEYNDYNLYDSNGNYIASGVFRSDNGSLSSFALTVDVNNNTWLITNGHAVSIPFAVGIHIAYTDRTTFLSQARCVCNGTTYNFSFIDDSGEFYCQNLPAGPYYYPVNVYLPVEGSAVDVPPTPILSYSDGYINWGTEGYYTEVYRSDDAILAGSLERSGLTGNGMKIREDRDGYYYIRFRYTVDDTHYYTDYSNRVYAEYVATAQEEEDANSTDNKIINLLEDIRNGFGNATSTITQFISDVGSLIQSIFVWLPEPVRTVFYAVVIIGLVLGLFLK